MISNMPGKPQSDKYMAAAGRRVELPTVVTDTVIGTGEEPVSAAEFEDREQVEPVGAPLQLKATVWLKPAIGLTAIV